jgi:hypothetical protein
VTYLIVGLDEKTLAPWRENIQARDVTAATRLALTRAQSRGIKLVVAAVIGPNTSVLPHPAGERAAHVLGGTQRLLGGVRVAAQHLPLRS